MQVQDPRGRSLGGMVPSSVPIAHATERVAADGRPQPAVRDGLRRIPSLRNAISVVALWLQIALIVWACAEWSPWLVPLGIVLMGRAFAQLASLMHEAAHRLLFADKRTNDWVGLWILGYPAFTPTDAYRRSHMAHHREEFGPNEPDIPLYAGYPIAAASLRRKLLRDATGRTGVTLMRGMFRGLRSTDASTRATVRKILLVQAVLFTAAIVWGHWWVYPVLWLLPYLTVWRLINRLRSIAEHGGMAASKDRRLTTHSVRQHWFARFLLVPYHIGFHLAHHVDSGVPHAHLPRFHQALRDAGYVDDSLEYASYPAVWQALVGRA